MKHLQALAIASCALTVGMGACNTDSTIGGSTTQDQVGIVVDSSFTVTGRSVPITRVQSRTINNLLGRIDADGYGRLSSEIVTQFMPSTQIVTDNMTVENIDSLMLYLYMNNGNYVGDSIAPMGIEVYRLTENLPSPIYSDFDPEGYYQPSSLLASKIYNVAYQSADTVLKDQYQISVKLPLELGRELYTAYVNDPSSFNNPANFADKVFKGLYIKNSYGSGRLLRISNSKMVMHYHRSYYDEDKQKDTTVYARGTYFAVTPEIITNSDISMEQSPELQARIDQGETIVQAPVGLEVEIEFPAPEVLAKFKNDKSDLSVLNSCTFTVPADAVANKYDFTMPAYLLLVLKKDKDQFFADNKLPDNTTSFYATFDQTTMSYRFGNMRPYLKQLLEKDAITPDDYTFVITPVSATFETQQQSYYYSQQVLALMTPYMAVPCMAQLHLDKAKIVLTYTTQTLSK